MQRRIYISATKIDLDAYRTVVADIIQKWQYVDVAMEHYVADMQVTQDKCIADVRSCELYILIVAFRYGWIPEVKNPGKRSITELEYRAAVEANVSSLVFMLDENAMWPPSLVDKDRTNIDRFRAELSNGPMPALFENIGDFTTKVNASLMEWLRQRHPDEFGEYGDFSPYFQAVSRRYQLVELEALAAPESNELLRLRLESVFVPQDVREDAPPIELPKSVWEKSAADGDLDVALDELSADEVRRLRDAFNEKPRLDLASVLTDPAHPSVVILGDPGSGKSTLARYLLLSVIQQIDPTLHERLHGHLPLLIELRSYVLWKEGKESDTFEQYLDFLGRTEGWNITAKQIGAFLKSDGRVLMIFDGLDEVFDPAERETIMRRIAAFAAGHPKSRVVVTSRIIGYARTILTNEGFAHYTLQDFNGSQVATFARQWYALALANRPGEAESRLARVLSGFRESASIRQLAGNPLLLTVMAIIGLKQDLPRERWKLYDHAASVLVQHWDVNRHLKDGSQSGTASLDEEDKKEMLRLLARRMQEGAGGKAGNVIHRDDLLKCFSGYFVERLKFPPDRAELAARAMVNRLRERNFILSLYGANVYGFVHRALLEYFCARSFTHDFEKTRNLSIEGMKKEVFGAHSSDQSWHEVLRLITGMIGESFAEEMIESLVVQGELPDIALAVQCMTEIRRLDALKRVPPRLLAAVVEAFDKQMITGLPNFEFFRDSIVPYVRTIGTDWPGRECLAQILARRMHRRFTFSWIYDRLFGQIIGATGAGIPAVFAVLQRYTESDLDGFRVSAPHALAYGWPDEPKAKEIVFELAASDPSRRVRFAAVTAIGEYFFDYATLLRYSDVDTEPEEYVRGAAIVALANRLDDPRVDALLRTRVHGDPARYVRNVSLSSLVERHRDPLAVRELLLDRAVNDPSPRVDDKPFLEPYHVREFALISLARLWPKDDEVRLLIRKQAESDPTPWLRERAANLLASFRN